LGGWASPWGLCGKGSGGRRGGRRGWVWDGEAGARGAPPEKL